MSGIDLFGDSLSDFNPLPSEWPDGLRFQKGAPSRLCGIEVYHDFVWQAVFDHTRSMFPQGQNLAALVQSDCPNDLTPALVLTTRADVQPGIRITDTHYIAVVKIHDYLNNSANPAVTYFTSALRAPISGLAALHEIEKHPQTVKAIISKHIDGSAIEEWVNQDGGRAKQLVTVLARIKAAGSPCDGVFDELLHCLAEDDISEKQLRAMVSALSTKSQLASVVDALAERADELELLKEVGTDSSRRMVAAALRAAHRTDAISQLRRLISVGAVESEFQRLLDENWWMLGTHYVERIEKRHWTDEETLDVLLRSADGFFDIVELKRSATEAFKLDHGKWVVSAAVNDATNQAAHYISEIERVRDNKIARYHVDLFRLNAIVLIGFIDDGDSTANDKRLALRMYNSHLNRIRVMSFDELLRIAEQVVGANVGEVRFAAGFGSESTMSELSACTKNSKDAAQEQPAAI